MVKQQLFEVQVGSSFWSTLKRAARSAGRVIKKTGIISKASALAGHPEAAGVAAALGLGAREKIYKVQMGSGFFSKIKPLARSVNAWFKKTKVISHALEKSGQPNYATAARALGYGKKKVGAGRKKKVGAGRRKVKVAVIKHNSPMVRY